MEHQDKYWGRQEINPSQEEFVIGILEQYDALPLTSMTTRTFLSRALTGAIQFGRLDTMSLLHQTTKCPDCLREGAAQERKEILEELDAVATADAFVGFTEEEWAGVKKFIKLNESIIQNSHEH